MSRDEPLATDWSVLNAVCLNRPGDNMPLARERRAPVKRTGKVNMRKQTERCFDTQLFLYRRAGQLWGTVLRTPELFLHTTFR